MDIRAKQRARSLDMQRMAYNTAEAELTFNRNQLTRLMPPIILQLIQRQRLIESAFFQAIVESKKNKILATRFPTATNFETEMHLKDVELREEIALENLVNAAVKRLISQVLEQPLSPLVASPAW